MYRVHTLPTTPTKEAAPEDSNKEAGKLHSIEDSLVLLQALRQSRQTWLTSSFTKFSTKSRGGKGSDIWQPPHNIRFRGKCDLEIGPHVFYATSVYEVTYQPYSVPVQTPLHYNQSYTTLSTPLVPLSQPHGAPALAYAPSTTAVVSSLKGSVPITPDFIAQVNAAAGSNPTLANLLGLAASGSATTEQLQTLGVTIQSLADNVLKTSNHQTGHGSSTCSRAQISIAGPSKAAVPPPAFTPPITKLSNSSSAPQQHVLSLRPQQAQSSIPASGAQAQPLSQQQSQEMQVIHKDSDVVIEFYENSYDRWTLPKNLVLYERVKRWDGNSSLADIIFSTTFPFEGSKPAVASIQSGEPSRVFNDAVHPITLRFFNVPPAIWNLFAQVAEDEERTKRVKASIDSQLDKAAPRSYLQYRIPDSTLLTQLQASASDRYPTKTIRPAVQASGATQTKRRASAILKGGTSAVGPTPKRKRTMTRKTESRTGTCNICKRASIVLAPDSPYCPPCTKKTGVLPTSIKESSCGVVSAGDGDMSQSQATVNPASTAVLMPTAPHIKGKKKQSPVTPVAFKHSLQTQYPATGRPPVPNYYAWQAQSPYAYHQYQQPYLQSQSGQCQPSPSQTSGIPAQPTGPSTSASTPTPTTQVSAQPTQTTGDLAAMD